MGNRGDKKRLIHERDFPHTERQEAKALYKSLVDGTTQKQMEEMGLHRA